jgi:hypothetical protein
MSECISGLLQDYRVFFISGFSILFGCFIGLIIEWNAYSLFTGMYQYIPCNIVINTQIIQPILINVSEQVLTTTCFHTPNHINELQIGAPPTVNNLLWIGVVIGLFLLGIAFYIHRHDT